LRRIKILDRSEPNGSFRVERFVSLKEVDSVLMDRVSELRLLREADGRIANAETAVMKQIAQLDYLRVAGYGTAVAERTLLAFVGTLEALRERRELIVRTIQQIDTGLI
jgi:hypothetical protein